MDDELPHSISRGPGWVEPIPGQRKPCGRGHLYDGRSIRQDAVEALDVITPWALYAERNPLSTGSRQKGIYSALPSIGNRDGHHSAPGIMTENHILHNVDDMTA